MLFGKTVVKLSAGPHIRSRPCSAERSSPLPPPSPSRRASPPSPRRIPPRRSSFRNPLSIFASLRPNWSPSTPRPDTKKATTASSKSLPSASARSAGRWKRPTAPSAARPCSQRTAPTRNASTSCFARTPTRSSPWEARPSIRSVSSTASPTAQASRTTRARSTPYGGSPKICPPASPTASPSRSFLIPERNRGRKRLRPSSAALRKSPTA